jgi:hypothetical protein
MLMRIAVFRRRRWPEAVEAAGHVGIALPAPRNSAYFESTLEDLIEHGRFVYDTLKKERVDLIVDAHGDGMLFVDDPRRKGMDALVHHRLGVPLVSHWTESLRILFKKVDPVILHAALQSPTWFKGVFVKAHVAELEWMGVPGCFHLPLAADDISYPSGPPATDRKGPKVFFAGNQQSLYFAHGDGVDTRTQWPGGIALAGVADGSFSSFLDAYRQYEFGPRPAPDDPPHVRAECVRQYYERKMFFGASRNLALRDRYVLFLNKKLGRDFKMVSGPRWRDIYGLDVDPPVPQDAYDRLIRQTPVCLNLVNGDNDGGLNLRHFEITAMGGFLLSHRQSELAEHFEIGTECEAFSNEAELIDKINYYCEHPDERAAIAEAGQRRALKEHLLHHRLELILARLHKGGHL